MIRHKHADVIHAYAEGAEIQYRTEDGTWSDIQNPSFCANGEYRIKPRTVNKEGWAILFRHEDGSLFVGAYLYDKAKLDDVHGEKVAVAKFEWEELL